jgi:hypothetical protein
MLENLNITNQPLPVSIESIIINIFAGAFLAYLIKIHFRKYSSTISNVNQFSNIFPIILLTTLLVISIVKSSLALSLGLVGALSIVRFRTPIKEPEELGYLFLTIAAGLGLGANQTSATLLSIIGILAIITIFKLNEKRGDYKQKNILLTVSLKKQTKKDKNNFLEYTQELVKKNTINFELKRMDTDSLNSELFFLITIKDFNNLKSIINSLKKKYSNVSINYIDQKQIPNN